MSADLTPREEDDLLWISDLQHFTFCRRQWALLRIEQQWADNVHTVEGELFHRKSHDETATERRGDLLITRSMPVFSHTLGVTGKCDVVEFHADPDGIALQGWEGRWRPYPIEYKKGKPKPHNADALQLCAQALCLEEMLVCSIPEGSLFYGEPHRRTEVVLDNAIREEVRQALAEMRALYQRGYTPRVRRHKGCKQCSVEGLCMPDLFARSADAYVRARLQEGEQ